MKDELDRAQIVRPTEVSAESVGFGTKVLLTNKESGETEEFVLLGPWESDPENGVISYLSPFGTELMNHRPGEVVEFEINERDYRYGVESVTVAEFA